MIPVLPLLTSSWQFYRSNFATLIGYAAWILVPYLALVVFYLLVPNVDQIFGPWLPLYIVIIFAQGIITIWASNAIMITVNEMLAEKNIKPELINRRSWHMIIPVLWVALISTLAVLGGFLLLIIPGVIFSIWFAFSQTAVVLDDKRGVDAMSYSRSLVVGRFWSMVRRIILGPFILVFIYLVVISLLVGLGIIITGLDASITETTQIPVWPDIVENVVNVFFLPLYIVYWTILYRNVKQTKA